MTKPTTSEQKLTYTIEKQESLYKGFFEATKYFLKHSLFAGGQSNTVVRELFVRTPAAAVLLYDKEADRVVLVEQFRPGAIAANDYPWMLEVVAGMAEPGEVPEEVIRREAVEESGCTINELIPLYSFYPSPGACSEVIHLYCGFTDSAYAGGLHGLREENEDIKVHAIQAEDALTMLDNGEINNATTIIALQWLRMFRQDANNRTRIP